MTRSPDASLLTHFALECNTLARLLTIRGVGANDVVKLTDHDQDLDIPARAVKATGGPLEADSTASGCQFASNALSIPSGNAGNNETVVISAETYTYKTTLTPAANEILIGVDAAASLLNLARAINGGAGSGTLYGAGTTSPAEGVTAIEPSQTSTSTNVIVRTAGTVIGNMAQPHNTLIHFADHGAVFNEMAFNGDIDMWTWRCARSLGRPFFSGQSPNNAWIGKDFTAAPATISSAKMYPSRVAGFFTPVGTLSTRTYIELWGSTGSLPADPGHPVASGSVIKIGTTGEFVNPFVRSFRGAGGRDTTEQHSKVITSTDTTSIFNYVWIIIDSLRPLTGGAFTLSELQLFGSSSATHPGATTMGLVADTCGDLPWNAMGTTETLATGNWANVTMTGGADAKENVLDLETVTIDGKVYTFETTLTDVDGNVHVGDTITDSLDNLKNAITLGGVAGTDYANSMTVHPTVTATTTSVGLFVEALVAGKAANGIAMSETMSKGDWDGEPMSGGEDGLYLSAPSFTASASQSSTTQGTEGVTITLPEEADTILQTDLISNKYTDAVATLEYTNWVTVPPDAFMTIFGGTIGAQNNTDEKELTFDVQGKFSRARNVRINTYSPLCRVDLGSPNCGFEIDDDKQTITVDVVTSQFIIETSGVTTGLDFDDMYSLGLLQWVTGNNAGIAIEISSYTQTNGVIKLFMPSPLTIEVGDTATIWPGCDKSLKTCANKFNNVANFRGEPFVFPAGAGVGLTP